ARVVACTADLIDRRRIAGAHEAAIASEQRQILREHQPKLSAQLFNLRTKTQNRRCVRDFAGDSPELTAFAERIRQQARKIASGSEGGTEAREISRATAAQRKARERASEIWRRSKPRANALQDRSPLDQKRDPVEARVDGIWLTGRRTEACRE